MFVAQSQEKVQEDEKSCKLCIELLSMCNADIMSEISYI